MSQDAEGYTATLARAASLVSYDEKGVADDGDVAEKGAAEEAPNSDFPEGGLRGWATLLGA